MHFTGDRKPAANKGFAIAGVPCFADTVVQGGSSVLRLKLSAKNTPPSPPLSVVGNPKKTHYYYELF